jgi:hypothetical protein
MSIYYKITNETENHYGYQYKDGLNVLEEPFDETLKCGKGGLYFTTSEFIHLFHDYGYNLRIVELPNDENFKMVAFKDKFKANMIILKEKYDLKNLNIEDVKKLLKLDKNLSRLFILYACILGNIQILEFFKNSEYEFKYDKCAINFESLNGHIKVLEWFKNSGYEFKYGAHIINLASEKVNIQVLEWFKNSGYKFKYDAWAINLASSKGYIQVLEWFKNSGY